MFKHARGMVVVWCVCVCVSRFGPSNLCVFCDLGDLHGLQGEPGESKGSTRKGSYKGSKSPNQDANILKQTYPDSERWYFMQISANRFAKCWTKCIRQCTSIKFWALACSYPVDPTLTDGS